MTVFADTPRWERHGIVWGHLVSDTSLTELHDLARHAGLPPRSFDLDHYDWPAPARAALVAAGAVMVGNRELTRRLLASGLRIPASRRAEARRLRSAAAAQDLGLARVPLDLITGDLGHVDPLPEVPGAFRLTRESADEPPRIEAHDATGRHAAHAFLAELDRRARSEGRPLWTGQVLDVVDPGGR